ncbi:hypothetical protein [Bradyrhizobium sp. CCGE-LA001]|uniref:hypothetical protein n=1 Tax=Bradyrhizobium sp. CCGE-LA001 TaxID=1223566 RepID=UPI0002AAC4B3|nr:hypothetical protein [Bradyrhizobium sp. CCGE-LA001]AMA55050.1 hypothetical protein BCCGELA001_01355 [Bradyrhizobium sp. CCGE-LA001]
MPTEQITHFPSKPGSAVKAPTDNLPPSAQKIAKSEEDLAEFEYRQYEQKQQRAAEIRLEIARAQNEKLLNERAQVPSEEVNKLADETIAAKKLELSALEEDFEAKRRLQPGNRSQVCKDFAQANVFRKLRTLNFKAELGPDLVAEHDACRTARAAKLGEKDAVRRAPVPASVIEAAIDRFYPDASTGVAHALRKLRTPRENTSSGRFSPRSFEPPMLTIPNGAGGLSRLNDTATLLFAVFGPEIRERLKAMALAGHDAEKAIPVADRPAMLKKIDGEILQIERLAEFIYRTGRARGINTGPRFAANPLAILDVEFA